MPVVDPAIAHVTKRYPSVSLLVPLDADLPWRDHLRRLADEAEARLRHEFGAGVDVDLVGRIHAAAANASERPVGDGGIASPRSLAVFVNDAGSEAVPLSVRVRERVVIDDTFATRDLVHAALRSPSYWVLALSLDRPRLLQGSGHRLMPAPLAVPPTAERTDARNRRGRDRSHVSDARRERRFRAMDAAVADIVAVDDAPIVVVGAEPSISHYLRISRLGSRIDGVVRRAPDAATSKLSGQVAAAVAEVIEQRRDSALAELDRAIGADAASCGLAEVWPIAHRARRALLLVEETFEQPARLLLNGAILPAQDAGEPGVIDDAIDEVIEAVLARGGRVELVPDGALDTHGRVALVRRTTDRR